MLPREKATPVKTELLYVERYQSLPCCITVLAADLVGRYSDCQGYLGRRTHKVVVGASDHISRCRTLRTACVLCRVLRTRRDFQGITELLQLKTNIERRANSRLQRDNSNDFATPHAKFGGGQLSPGSGSSRDGHHLSPKKAD